jgi:glycosyltransferase involved in cell wall biosynthesis
LVQKRGWQRQVHLHGQVTNPYPLVASADAFVLPSRSEGLSRAALEALYLGVPCVLRDVDGNGELVANPEAGALFCRDADLGPVLTEVVIASRKRDSACSLLPPAFRQEHAAQRYRELMENTL